MSDSTVALRLITILIVGANIWSQYSFAAGLFVCISLLYQLESVHQNYNKKQ